MWYTKGKSVIPFFSSMIESRLTEVNMPMDQLLKLQEKFDIQVFDGKQNLGDMKKKHACFTGSPRKHPDRDDMIILVSDPFSPHPTYLEFKLQDISYVERLSNEVNEDGDTAATARLWVKKGSVGVRCIPFLVDHISIPKII